MKFLQFLGLLVFGSILLFPFAQMYEQAKYKPAAVIEVRSVLDNHFLAMRDHYIYTEHQLSLEDFKELEPKLKMRIAFKHKSPSMPIDEIKGIKLFWEGVKTIAHEDHNLIDITIYSDEILISFIKLVESKALVESSTIVRDFLREKWGKKEELRKENRRLRDQLIREREKEIRPSNSSDNLDFLRRSDAVPMTT